MQMRKGGRWRSTASAQAYINGAWRDLGNAKAYIGGRWRDVCNFTAVAPTPTPTPTPTPSPVIGLSISPNPFSGAGLHTTITSEAITATPSGGRSPYSYAWTFTRQDGPATINSPTSASTTVTSTGASEVTVKCVCTDSTGLAGSATASGTFEQVNTDPSGPIDGGDNL
jgi:hypothetical protein